MTHPATPVKSETWKADAAEAKAAAKAGPLLRASESSDPAVHKAMADLDAARMNRAALDTEEADIEAADKAVEDAKKALAELGFE